MDLSMVMEHIDAIGLLPVLLWQSMRLEKRLDHQAEQMEQQRRENDGRNADMIKGWEKQLNEMLNKHEHKEELVRDRYDQVVNKLDRERKEQIDKLLEEMRQVQIKIDDMVRFIARPMR